MFWHLHVLVPWIFCDVVSKLPLLLCFLYIFGTLWLERGRDWRVTHGNGEFEELLMEMVSLRGKNNSEFEGKNEQIMLMI